MASDFCAIKPSQHRECIMKQHINDLRVATAYKKQLTDKFNLKDNDVFIDAQTNWVQFEAEFELDGHKFHPYIRYENKNVNTPRIMDITLYFGKGPTRDLAYKSYYVESAKVSEVSMYNILEMCKNMKFEMLRVEQDAEEWLSDPNQKRWGLPDTGADEDLFWEKLLFAGSVGQNGWIGPKESIERGSEEFKELREEHTRMMTLLNTFPGSFSPGRTETEEVGSYELKHILERIDRWRTKGANGYFSNGAAIATLPYYLRDRFTTSDVVATITSPNVDLVLDKHFITLLRYLDKLVS